MKIIAIILVLTGLIGLVFAAWGIYTPAGRTKYDEMDGLYPIFAGLAGGLLIVIALVLAIIILRRGP